MTKFLTLASLALLGSIAVGAARADDKPAATVNGVAIPQERIEFAVRNAAAQGQPDVPELRQAIRDNLVNYEILSQEAVKQGMDKQPDAIQQLEMSKQNVLANALVQDYVKTHPISDEVVAREYEKLKAGMGSKEYKLRHILVDKEDNAKSILAKLKKGGSFDKLAKANSRDPGSKDHGGDLGWIPVGNISSAFVKPFADAALKLDKGQLSEPVQSQFGWHIIKLDDVRDATPPALDEIKGKLTLSLQQQAVKQFVSDLRTKAKVE
ncbi:MAG: peptidylprolyl isomerase [Nitrosomonadales bacterium]|nr:peptidylprolyl isomerase [Nitrosomonadales bacterium]